MQVLAYIDLIEDPRQDYKVVYPLTTLLFTTLCAILCGCQSWHDVEDYCYSKRKWLSQYIDLSMGTPSSWTFRRLFTLLDPFVVETLLKEVAAALLGQRKSDQIVIDGKALKGSKRHNVQCLKSVSAWCYENGLVLAEKAVDQRSHESRAIPLLLETLDLKGTTVSIDAAGCNPAIAEAILKKKAHYVLALKKNQPKLYDTVTTYMKEKGQNLKHLIKDGFDDGHGRSVRRRYFACPLSHLNLDEKWPELKTVLAVETISGKPRSEVTADWRYYITSHSLKHPELPDYVRNHWSIENKLHWALDVQMREDDDLKAERKSAKAFATLRRIALNIVRVKDQTPKRSVRRKMMCAAWNEDNLLKLLV